MTAQRSAMVSTAVWGVCGVVFFLAPLHVAWAQDGAGQAAGASTEADSDPRAALQKIVYGLYFEAQAGIGYTVKRHQFQSGEEGIDNFHGIVGQDDGLGLGSAVIMALGYDISSAFALEAYGGLAMIGSSRTDRVRDLALQFAGAALRVGIPVGRWRFGGAAGGGLMVSDNSVEASKQGFGARISLGGEYYVHVRHFSVGLDLTTLVALDPQRVFTFVTPRIRYTF